MFVWSGTTARPNSWFNSELVQWPLKPFQYRWGATGLVIFTVYFRIWKPSLNESYGKFCLALKLFLLCAMRTSKILDKKHQLLVCSACGLFYFSQHFALYEKIRPWWIVMGRLRPSQTCSQVPPWQLVEWPLQPVCVVRHVTSVETSMPTWRATSNRCWD